MKHHPMHPPVRLVSSMAALTALILVATIATAGAIQRPGRSLAWPLEMRFELDYQDEPSSAPLRHAAFSLVAADWTAWTLVQDCCGPDTGFVLQLRADGSVWSGGDRGTAVEFIFRLDEPSEGMVPLFDFAPRFASTREDLRRSPSIAITGDADNGLDAFDGLARVRDAAARLGLDPAGLLAYRVTEEPDGSYRDVVVFLPLNLVVQSSEFVDGVQTRHLIVTWIGSLPAATG